MHRLQAAIKKETLLMLRDRSGLIILFLMPVVLVVVMTLVQDVTFRRIDETRLEVLFLDRDMEEFGRSIEKGLSDSEYFILIKEHKGKLVTEAVMKELVSQGDYQIGVVVHEGATRAIRENAQKMTEEMLGGGSLTSNIEDGKISILFDPVIRNSFRLTILNYLRNQISQIEMSVLFESISTKLQSNFPGMGSPGAEQGSSIVIEESYAQNRNAETMPSATQHNIPGWAIFAMFFIVIPLTGNIIREKSEGISLRLHMFPRFRGVLITSKILVYSVVCILQFLVMVLVGIFIFPYLGLPSLETGSNLGALFIMTLVTAVTAISYGMAIGFIATTHDQAASFGTVSVIILSALGGLWVPTFLMPEVMKTLASMSPLNWSLEGYYEIFLRGGGSVDIFPYVLKLFLFSTALILILFFVQLSRKR